MKTMPSADDFRALARSAPWRWSRLRCTVTSEQSWWVHRRLHIVLRRPTDVRVVSDTGELDRVQAVTHHGRAAWQATVTPITGAYDPRCSCCPLLPSAAAEARMGFDQGGSFPSPTASNTKSFPSSWTCRLPSPSGITPLDGGTSTPAHDIVIEEVDAPIPDALFQR